MRLPCSVKREVGVDAGLVRRPDEERRRRRKVRHVEHVRARLVGISVVGGGRHRKCERREYEQNRQ
jgi:hypothetical protein